MNPVLAREAAAVIRHSQNLTRTWVSSHGSMLALVRPRHYAGERRPYGFSWEDVEQVLRDLGAYYRNGTLLLLDEDEVDLVLASLDERALDGVHVDWCGYCGSPADFPQEWGPGLCGLCGRPFGRDKEDA